MEDIIDTFKSKLNSKMGGMSQEKFDIIKKIDKYSEMTESKEKKHYLEYLNNKEDLSKIYNIVKSSKFSVKDKRKKIKEFLEDPETIDDFFKMVLQTKTNKEENKEATGAASAGGYTAPFLSTETDPQMTKGDLVKTVREQVEKVEAKEATSSASSGQYSQPAIWAKSMSKKHWKGASTKYMPGAKRVQVKKKCKKFPYCNQGDIKALKIFENESVQNAIDSVSSMYGIDKNFISEIVFQQIRKRQK